MQAALHAVADVCVARLLAGVLDEEHEGRAPVLFDERECVHRFGFVGALVDLGRDDALARDDLPVLAVECDLEPAGRHHHVAPRAANTQIDFGDRGLAPVSAPPGLDEFWGGPRLVDQMSGCVELPGDEDLSVRRGVTTAVPLVVPVTSSASIPLSSSNPTSDIGVRQVIAKSLVPARPDPASHWSGANVTQP